MSRDAPEPDPRELLKNAVAAMRELRARLQAQEERSREPIAVIGMGCRFPGGADSPETFWQLLEARGDAVADIPADRFPVAAYHDRDPDAPGKIATRRGAFLPGVDRFDADFFGIPAREAIQMDPQQRLLLEVAWEALEDAGVTAEGLASSLSSVFVGAIAPDYMWRQLADPGRIDAYSGTGTHTSLLSGRLSYLLDLRGPSLTIDTACSSSLVAVHLACQSLRQRESDLAIAGGVNLVTSPVSLMAFSRMGLLAPDGLCKTFDARADGFVPGEGCGVVILKRLQSALADGDNIRAVIRGTAVNQDGRSSTLTAPNGPAQADVIRRSMAQAGISADRVTYVEAHGTGTALGDPIEVEALKSVLGGEDGVEARCALGAVKTNIGHLGAAAGIAGLIKVVLSLEHRRIAANLHLHEVNPHIALDGSRLFLPVEPVDWTDARGPLCAGLSSFGWSGTNAHAILEEAPKESMGAETGTAGAGAAAGPYLLPLSARSAEALAALARDYADVLSRAEGAPALPGLLYTAALRRSHHRHRRAVAGDSAAELAQKLRTTAGDPPAAARGARGAVFVFCGQGSQWPGMGMDLYARETVFRAAMDEADAGLRRLAGWSILDTIGTAEQLENTEIAQPAIFALQVALARLWRSWGVEPVAVVGHSLGEVAAAHVAGVLDFDQALRVVVARGRRMQAATGLGAMAEVALTRAQAEDFLPAFPELAVVACNSPTDVVLGGPPAPLQAAVDALTRAGTRCSLLRVRYAFHSAQMDPFVAPLVADLQGLKPAAARLPIFSTLRGGPAEDGDFDAGFWGRSMRQPVLFADAINAMIGRGDRLFLEIGPHPVLSGAILGGLQAAGSEGDALASLRRARPEGRSMRESLAALYGAGLDVRFDRIVPAASHVRPLPAYPWQRKRYWLDVVEPAPARRADAEGLSSAAIAWVQVAEPPSAAASSNWLLLEATPGDLGQALSARLERDGARCARASFGAGAAGWDATLVAGPGGRPEPLTVVFIAPERSAPDQAQGLCAALLGLSQACLQSRRDLTLWLVTRGAQAIHAGGDVIGVAQAPLIGLARTLAAEVPQIWGGAIDLAPDWAPDGDALLARIRTLGAEREFAIGPEGTFVPRLTTADAATGAALRTVQGDRAYLITGGLGSIGLAIAAALVAAGARHLMLFGRGAPSAIAADAIRELERQGATCTLCRGDVASRQDVDRAVALFGTALPPLAGVVHAAGHLSDAALPAITPDRLQAVLAPKVAGAWNLHAAVGDRPLDFFVMMSSLASVLGSEGQAAYSAANAFLDGLAQHRQATGLRGLAINWGPWAGTAMTDQVPDRARRRWTGQGISPFPAAEGTALFLRLALGEAAQRCAARVDWDRLRQARPELAALTSRLAAPRPDDTPPAAEDSAADQFRRATDRDAWLRSWVRRRVAQILAAAEDEVAEDRSLLDQGFDSLMVMQLLRAVGQAFGRRLYAREFYDRPTVRGFAAYVTADLMADDDTPPPTPAAAAVPVVAPKLQPAPPAGRLTVPVVFLLSAPRSGSTLLRVMLAGHPALFCPPELHLLGFATMAGRRTALRGTSMDEGLIRAIKALKACSTAEARAVEADWVAADLPIRAVYDRLQDMARGRILVDKSPSYAMDYGVLHQAEEIFASARYIHLLRHPLAVRESFARNRFDRLLGMTDASPRAAAERVWRDSNRNVSDLFATVDPARTTTIRYETLVRAPDAVMGDLCAFLGVPFDPSVLQPYQGDRMTDGLEPQSLGIGDPAFLDHTAIDPSRAEVWSEAETLQPLGPETRRLALDYNYDLPEVVGAETGMREEIVEVRGLPLCLCSWGPPNGPAVLILHGLLDHGAAWDGVARALAARGFRVLAPDQRGHGRSPHVGPASTYHLTDFLADADALQRLGDGPVTLVGHSMGASVAAMLAAARPERVRRLVLVEPVLATDRGDRTMADILADHLDALRQGARPQVFADAAAAAARLRAVNPAMPEADAARMAARLLEPCPGGLRWRWDDRLRTQGVPAQDGTLTLDAPRFLSLLGGVAMPVTLIVGADSAFGLQGRNAKLRDALRDGPMITLPGGHNLHHDCSALLAGRIAEAAASTAELAEP